MLDKSGCDAMSNLLLTLSLLLGFVASLFTLVKRLADVDGTSHEYLSVQILNGIFGIAFVHGDESKASCVSIFHGDEQVMDISKFTKVVLDVFVGGIKGQVANVKLLLAYKEKW